MNTLQPFELLEDLRPEHSAMAVLLNWEGTRYVRTKDQIEVFEFVGTHGNKGDRGYCFHSPLSNRWEAVSGLYQQVPKRATL